MGNYYFTSESVTEGHPDKMCDAISDAILDAVIEQDPMGRVACETAITTGLVVVMGEITTRAYIDISQIVRNTISEIGYDDIQYGFDAKTCCILTCINGQSNDIAIGVDKAFELKKADNISNKIESIGAGDQGMMFGFATNETKEFMPYDKNTLIIYVTSHENHMQESFEVRPFRFLVKPVSEKQIESCFKSAYEEVYCEDSYFRYSYQRVNHKIPMREILYFESNKRKVFIVTEKGTFVAYAKLNDIEESLKQSKVPFLRVHQSYLVNYKHVEGQAYDFVVMDNSKKISISEDRRKLIGEQYCSMEDTIYVGE